jgi:hypothetical protein
MLTDPGQESLDELRARLAILELVAAYGVLFDAAYGPHADPSWDAKFSALWSKNAIFGTYPDLVVSQKEPMQGRDTIVAEFKRINDYYPHPHFVRHMTTNTIIDEMDLSSGRVRARSVMVAAGVHDFSELKVHRTGVYFDRFCMENGRWCFDRRDLVYDGPEGPGDEAPKNWF